MPQSQRADVLNFDPHHLEYRDGEVIRYIVTVQRESLARFDPPGLDQGTPSPGFSSGPVPDRPVLCAGSRYFSLCSDRLQRCTAPAKFPVDYSWISA